MKNNERKLTIFRHYIQGIEGIDLNNIEVCKKEHIDTPKVVLKEENDANIVQAYIATKLGLKAPNIKPVYSLQDEKIVMQSEFELPKGLNRNRLISGEEYGTYMNYGAFVEICEKLTESDRLSESEKDIYDYISKKIEVAMKKYISSQSFDNEESLYNLHTNVVDKDIEQIVEGNVADDFLNQDKVYAFSRFFEQKAIRDIVKSRLARIATFDRSLVSGNNLYYTNRKRIVTDVFPMLNNINRLTIYTQNCDKDTSNLSDMYQSEFSKKALPISEIAQKIKQSDVVSDAFGKDGIREMADSLSEISLSSFAKEYSEQNAGYEISKKYTTAVEGKISEIVEELKR